MIHISQDKRSQTSAKLIGEAMLTLLAKKPFDEIAISDIQRESTVGRSTFYRLFDSTVDVLSYLCSNIFDSIAVQPITAHQTFREAMICFIDTWLKHEVLLRAIIKSDHLEVLYKMFFQHMPETRDVLFDSLQMDKIKEDYFLSILTSTMVGGLTAWSNHNKIETAAEVLENVTNSMKIFYETTTK